MNAIGEPTETHANGDSEHAGYAPHEHRPLGSYAALTGVFGAGLSGALLALRASGRELPERLGLADVLLVGIASHKLSRMTTKDKATSFLRAPFTRFQADAGHAEVSEEPRGSGARRAIGELLICPYCLAQWITAAMSVGLVAAPRQTRFIAAIYAELTLADFLQLAYRAAEERA
ncbi:MAG TPA: DUF1360 domain-containing protein [Solirubrobacteraceae bacterium]|jgi:hypothetical protein|nr:DUF1360 domain-containing protein [Solirubrobacteraceae bacterium]